MKELTCVRAISRDPRGDADTCECLPRGGVDLATGVSGQVGLLAERKGGFAESPFCLGHRVPSAIAAVVAGYTSRRGNNAARYCRLALSPLAAFRRLREVNPTRALKVA